MKINIHYIIQLSIALVGVVLLLGAILYVLHNTLFSGAIIDLL